MRSLRPVDGRGASLRTPRPGYVLLETVIATGLLVLALAVLGGQVQDSDMAVRRMDRHMHARHLAAQFFTLMESRMIEFDSLDEIIEEEFGPREPSYAWRVTLDNTIYDELVQIRLDILYQWRQTWDDEEFNFNDAEIAYTVYALKLLPRPINLGESFGMSEEEITELSDKLGALGIDGLDPTNFDPAFLGKMNFEDLIQALPTIMDAFGMDITSLKANLPPEALEALKAAGVEGFGGEGDNGGADGGDALGGGGG